jgi:hypothetical protein
VHSGFAFGIAQNKRQSNSSKSAQRLSNRIALVKAVLFCHSALALFLEKAHRGVFDWLGDVVFKAVQRREQGCLRGRHLVAA